MNPPSAPLDRPAVVLHRTRPVLLAAVATLLALHWLLAVGSKRTESVTADELAHLTGGFTYWQVTKRPSFVGNGKPSKFKFRISQSVAAAGYKLSLVGSSPTSE